MKLLFEKSKPGVGGGVLAPCDTPDAPVPAALARQTPLGLPSLDENTVSRHYAALARRSFGVNDGFYPLGSCTMKYNPKAHEEIAGLRGFTDVHPLQDPSTVRGCQAVLDIAAGALKAITGMDALSFQPAAGAQGEFAGLLMIKAYHQSRGDAGRTTILAPDSAHGTNPASAAMAGFTVATVRSGPDGCVDLDALRAACGPDTAGIMLTNPNTLGIFDPNILAITRIVHEAGGLCYYDGANLNAIMGIARPGAMGFDVTHLNLHKSFAAPHGGGGPGAAALACKAFLAPFLPGAAPAGIGRLRAFHGNFLVVVRAAAYLLGLGREGAPAVARDAVLNANYLLARLRTRYAAAAPGPCMHEFVLSLDDLRARTGVSALDVAKALQDRGIHPPTIYFPLIVKEALMVEPTETESKETLDEAAAALLAIYDEAVSRPEALHAAPVTTPVSRPDEVRAARQPVLCAALRAVAE